jgi:hypothetical protein
MRHRGFERMERVNDAPRSGGPVLHFMRGKAIFYADATLFIK